MIRKDKRDEIRWKENNSGRKLAESRQKVGETGRKIFESGWKWDDLGWKKKKNWYEIRWKQYNSGWNEMNRGKNGMTQSNLKFYDKCGMSWKTKQLQLGIYHVKREIYRILNLDIFTM